MTQGLLWNCSPTTVDAVDPVVTRCPDAASGAIPTGQSSVAVNWLAPTASDNSQLPVSTDSTHSPGDTFGLGVTTVIYTFTDSVGNTATCSFLVTVTCK